MSERVKSCFMARLKQQSEWVFPSPRSKAGHLTTVANLWRKARNEAGLDPAVKL
jgi:hypothetical protein